MMNPKSHKPQQLLTELEREPIVYLGCTWTEIISQLYKSAGVSLLIAICLSATFGFLGFQFPTIFAVFMMAFLILTLVITRAVLKRIAKNRIGKPLFYEKHINTYRSKQFIQPKYIKFQRERNYAAQKQK